MRNYLLILALALLSAACTARPERPQTIAATVFSPDGTPFRAVPSDRWGALQPIVNARAEVLIDTTWRDGEPYHYPFPHAVDVVSDASRAWAFFATGRGIQIHDVTDPTNPRKVSYADGSTEAPYWQHSDKNAFLKYLSVLPRLAARPRLVATGADEFGFIVWDASDPRRPVVIYQDSGVAGRYVGTVYSKAMGGRDYALAVDTTTGLVLYDLTAASAPGSCPEPEDGKAHENTRQGDIRCAGVYRGTIARNQARGVHGVGDLVAMRHGGQGVDVFKIDSPVGFSILSPRIAGRLPAGGGDVAMWSYDYSDDGNDNPRPYLASVGALKAGGTKFLSHLWIYDVACALDGSCSLDLPVAVYDVTDWSSTNSGQSLLTLSVDRGKPWLYVGNVNIGGACVDQREFLLDLSRLDPEKPVPVTPLPPYGLDLTLVGPADDDAYWGWYYSECGGFNNTKPMRAVVENGIVVRAFFVGADQHRIVGEPPPPPDEPPLFKDGFESGDLGAWWAVVSGPSGFEAEG